MQQSVKPKREIHRMVDPMCCPLLGNTFSNNTITTTANNNNNTNKLINTPTKEKRRLASKIAVACFKLLQRVALHNVYVLIAIYVLLPYQIHGYNSRKSCVYLSYLLQILSKVVAFFKKSVRLLSSNFLLCH